MEVARCFPRRRLENVRGKFGLTALAYNSRRAITLSAFPLDRKLSGRVRPSTSRNAHHAENDTAECPQQARPADERGIIEIPHSRNPIDIIRYPQTFDTVCRISATTRPTAQPVDQPARCSACCLNAVGSPLHRHSKCAPAWPGRSR